MKEIEKKDTGFMQKILGTGLVLLLFLSLFGVIFFILVDNNEDIVRLCSVQTIILGLSALWLAGKFWKGETGFVQTSLNIPILIFLLTSLISIIRAKNPYQGFSELFNLSIYVLFYFLIVNNIRDEKYITRFITALLILTTVISIHSILQCISPRLDFLWFMFPPDASFSRASSVFGNADFLGGYLAMVFPLGFSLFLFRKRKLFFCISSVLVFLSLLLTFTRSAWVSWAISVCFLVIIFLIYRPEVIKKNLVWLTGGLLGFILLALILNFIKGGMILSRVSAIFNWGEYNVQVRFGLWRSALEVFRRSPITGVGLDNFKIVAQGCRIHNEYLQILAETGILGLIAFSWLIFSYFRVGFKALESITPYRQVLGIAFMSSVFAMLVDSLFCFPLHRLSHNVLFWAILGLTVALGNTGRVEMSTDTRKMGTSRILLPAGIVAGCVFAIFLIWRSFTGVYYYQKGFDMNRYADRSQEMREKTRQCFEKAAHLAPFHYQIQHDWAIVAIQSGDLEKGKKAMQWSERLYPDRLPDVRLNLGLLYYEKGNFEEAEKTWKETIQKFPSCARAYFYLGGFYINRNKMGEALKFCSRAVELEPTNSEYLKLLARVYFRTGNMPGARDAVSKGLAISPDDQELLNMQKALR